MAKTPKKTDSGKSRMKQTAKPASKAAARQAEKLPEEPKPNEKGRRKRVSGPLYVVGIGGSAGALEAFEQFFSAMPPDSGLAFVLVPHLDPTHKGMMPELLQRITRMEVRQAEDGMKVEPNNVYVVPSNKDMSILHGALQLLEPSAPRGLRLPIDFFLRHLADDQGERAICVLVSGMGTDGTLGLKAVKEKLGLAMVQDPATAKFEGMPRSAIDTGLVDFTASPPELAVKLLEFVRHYAPTVEKTVTVEEKKLSTLQKIFVLLRSHTGHDFSLYKKNTVIRRVERRMAVHQLDTIEAYVRYLQENSQEIDLLFKELLIGVTNFFRDPGAYEALMEKGLPRMLQGKTKRDTLRVWIPGCSTGEEAYSTVITLVEYLEKNKQRGDFSIQVFATDIDKDAIDKARLGTYPTNIAADVSEERLQRYFVKEEYYYRIRKEIREMVVFAPHDIIIDPPFTKLDLLCCRNLLIYFNPELQKKLIPLFHYALAPGGILFLGTSETIGTFGELFQSLDGKWKVFQRKETMTAIAGMLELPSSLISAGVERDRDVVKLPKGVQGSVPDVTQRILLEECTPPAVLINSSGDIIYISGRTGKFLELSTGKAAMNIFSLARPGLGIELAAAVRKAMSQNREVLMPGLQVKHNGGMIICDLIVKPLSEPDFMKGLLLAIFNEVEPGKTRKGKGRAVTKNQVVDELEKEVKYLRETLQTTNEEMETSQEELKSANEELQSTNEELQSSNEELTTSKEELQSLNEELLTVNSELQTKIEELTQSNNDMRNLLNSTEVATIFLDNGLNVKRFTSQATRIFNLIQTDIGRPLTHLVSNLRYEKLDRDVREVVDTLIFKEVQVQSTDGHWFTLRIMPYRTAENVIDGAILTFVDITTLKNLEAELRHLAAIVESSSDAIIGQNNDGIIVSWNRGAELLFGYAEEEAKGRPISLVIPPEQSTELAEMTERVKKGEKVESSETMRRIKGGGTVCVSQTISPIRDATGNIIGASFIIRQCLPKKGRG